MSQAPPPVAPPPPQGAYGGYPAPGPQKTNGPAIASLVCGLLGFCVPFLLGLVAIVLGAIGIKKTKDPQTGGKGLAIAGLILGVLSVGMWGIFGGGILALFKGTEAQRDVARQFIKDLSAGTIDAAVAQTDGTIPREDLEKLSKTVQGWGALTDTTIVGISAQPGRTQVGGSATFGSTVKGFEAVVVKGADGSYKISGFHFQ